MLNYYYFCAKLRKKVETVKFIIGILIVVIALILEVKKQIDKNKPVKKAVSEFTPLPVEKNSTPVPAVSKKRIPIKNAYIPKTEAHTVSPQSAQPDTALFDEGQRVTSDITSEQPLATADESSLSPNQADELRNRIIWGEILARKF